MITSFRNGSNSESWLEVACLKSGCTFGEVERASCNAVRASSHAGLPRARNGLRVGAEKTTLAMGEGRWGPGKIWGKSEERVARSRTWSPMAIQTAGEEFGRDF